ncbi:MAG TPA: cytochrome c oxidase assembly protein [Acidimicrobiales bacterium]|nr:cytochrome c oxidase assembly protein [Acidimicrobiales bacterium]
MPSIARPRRDAAAFIAGAALLAIALSPPVESKVEQRLSVHMIQHLLIVSAAPLVAIGQRRVVNSLLNREWRRKLRGSRLAIEGRRFGRRSVAILPLAAALAHIGVLAVWHLPGAYDAALDHEALHVSEHATLFMTAFIVWVGVRAARRVAPANAIAALFAVSIAGAALGALITFARTPLYRSYDDSVSAQGAGMTVLEDQQLAGALMWVFGGLLYLSGAISVVVKSVKAPTSTRDQAHVAAHPELDGYTHSPSPSRK